MSQKKIGVKANIIDEYVSAGSKTINISKEDISKFKEGDLINVCHPATNEWAAAIEMDNIKNVDGKDTSWGNNGQNMITERTITQINGTQITLDFPIMVPLIKKLSQCYIQKINDDERIEDVGIENLRIVSYYNGNTTDEQHATIAISITNAKNIFVRDVTAKHFYKSIVSCGKKSKQVTVQNCSYIEPVSKIAGGRRYSFACTTSAQQLLYTGCYSSKGRHDYETSFEVTGPIVFLDDVADESSSVVGPHGTWSTGILYDNVYLISNDTKASIGFKNQGIYGSNESQGWTTASAVAWNCLAPAIVIHKPPMYQNFMIGTWGIYKDSQSIANKKSIIDNFIFTYRTSKNWKANKNVHFATKEDSPFVGDGYVEAEYTPVEPRSLYKAQLSERFTGTIKNARPNAPIIVNPKYDRKYKNNSVTVSGFCELGASKVTIYIDDIAYEAKITSNNGFSFTKTLKKGVHKIYATQTIKGNESTKTADRFIIVGKTEGNEAYLQSIYTIDKTSLLINDPRETFVSTYVSNSSTTTNDSTKKDENTNKITVIINDVELESDIDPFILNGRTLVPIRAIFEALNADVDWETETQTAIVRKNNKTIKITKNQTIAYVNNKAYKLDVPAMIVENRFVVPVRFISESLEAKVEWDGKTKTVKIYS